MSDSPDTAAAAALTLRRATPDDAAAYARIMGHPQVLPGLLQMPYPSVETWRTRLAESLMPGKTDLLLVAERDGLVVGCAGLHPFAQMRRRHAAVLGIAVAHEAQGQGVGRALMQALCDWADRWAALLRIELTVFADNEPAIALYRRFGFETEGRLRAYGLRDGEYVDVLTMARLHPNPPRLPPSAA
ncbi:hypothetical protein CKO44_11090 [Rubrivivax gelatinosus]|uniref:N-acetyltransferase domain-containing protein n=1 Tax=Rubrivivax gelatinosus TaxID=28068 RepID=A0ABS1DV66_RUBGE|nr:GNAT family N-acetyltransferase [Rubrivivax gelatinosus]MBK1614012.1 hypothetical protein [Rubrivivax gelatinosus]MBK1712875.1 hypothetical protein [Rubrivivax gelatinosus]